MGHHVRASIGGRSSFVEATCGWRPKTMSSRIAFASHAGAVERSACRSCVRSGGSCSTELCRREQRNLGRLQCCHGSVCRLTRTEASGVSPFCHLEPFLMSPVRHGECVLVIGGFSCRQESLPPPSVIMAMVRGCRPGSHGCLASSLRHHNI